MYASYNATDNNSVICSSINRIDYSFPRAVKRFSWSDRNQADLSGPRQILAALSRPDDLPMPTILPLRAGSRRAWISRYKIALISTLPGQTAKKKDEAAN
jgi:hypothetical protein